ncbi:MAG: hydantoinase/oxoprolinase family protein [Geminicoccaceae bacterium]
MTDCSLILGHIDADFFLGGAMPLDRAERPLAALEAKVAAKLDLPVEEAAAAVLALATEENGGGDRRITVNQGIDPSAAVLIGGGGAAGLNAVAVGRRLGCAAVLIPEAGAVLSAAGASCRSWPRLCPDALHGEPGFRLRGSRRRAGRPRKGAGVRPGARRGCSRNGNRILRRGPLPAPDLGDRGAAGRPAHRRACGSQH